MRNNLIGHETKFLVDTDIIINTINKSDTKILSNLHGQGILYISVLTEYELFLGIYEDRLREEVGGFIYFLKKIDVTSDICRKAAEFARKNKYIEQALKPVDLLIGATCFIHKLKLVTGNKKHFRLIPDIEIYE